jgi:ureidoglycolate hydrolase
MRNMRAGRSLAWLVLAAGALCSPAADAAPDAPPKSTAGTALAAGLPVVSVAPEPLTAAGFRQFGEVIEVPGSATPTIETGILRYWGGLAKARIHEQIEFGLFTVKAREREVAEMERHARTPEFLVSLSGEFLLAVAPASVGTAAPQAAKVRVFIVKPGQAVLLSKATWHALPFPKADEGLFVVAFREATATRDLKVKPFKGREVVKF